MLFGNLSQGQSLKKFIATSVVSTMLISASTAFAGGPVIIEEEMEVIVEKPASSVG